MVLKEKEYFPNLLETTLLHQISVFRVTDFKLRLLAEGKFQTNLQAEDINFLIWKFRFIILFYSFFTEFDTSNAFYTLLLLFQRICLNCNLMQKLQFKHDSLEWQQQCVTKIQQTKIAVTKI